MAGKLMPYFISQDTECPDWAVIKDDDTVIACHPDKESAIAQMVAISIEENIEPGGERKVKKGKLKYRDDEVTEATRDLPDNYRPALAEDVPEGRACGNCIFFNEDRQNEDGTKAWCERWEDFADGGYYCNAWEPKEAQERMKVLANSLIARINTEETMETNNKWLDVARAIALKIDGPQTKEPEVRVKHY
jgi:hypothetical protein